MADRPCDCLRPKSSLCSCQHWQWFCVGRDAIAIQRARITPSAEGTWNTGYTLRSVLHWGWVTFGEYFTGKGASPTNQCWYQKTRVIAVSCGIKISAVRHLVLSQYTCLTERRTDGRIDRQTGLRQQYRALHYMQSHGKNWEVVTWRAVGIDEKGGTSGVMHRGYNQVRSVFIVGWKL